MLTECNRYRGGISEKNRRLSPHKYHHRGTYHVVVTVTDDEGAAGTNAFTVTVN